MKVLINATLIDGTGALPRKGMKILLDGKRISAIGRNITIPEDAEIIDLKGRILMPGLIDAHSHFGDHPYKDRPGIDSAERSDSYAGMRKLTLEAGVTTIRSCGDYMYDTAAVRDKINGGSLRGPRLICSGKSFMRRDSHPATTVWAGDPGTVENCGAYPQTAEEARVMVREAADAGMDFIKIVVCDTHVMFWPAKTKQLSDDVIAAIIDEAHKKGLPTACHVDHLKQAEQVFAHGADEIHHLHNIGAPYRELDDYNELFRGMCRKNIWLVPTLTAPRAFEGARISSGCTDGTVEYTVRVLKRAYEFGVPFGLGCDSGCPGVPWGRCVWDEMADYVYNLGMTPLEAIRCATANNAQIIGMANELGVIRAGAYADLLILDKDPTTDIGNMDSVAFVMRDGEVVYSSDKSASCGGTAK